MTANQARSRFTWSRMSKTKPRMGRRKYSSTTSTTATRPHRMPYRNALPMKTIAHPPFREKRSQRDHDCSHRQQKHLSGDGSRGESAAALPRASTAVLERQHDLAELVRVLEASQRRSDLGQWIGPVDDGMDGLLLYVGQHPGEVGRAAHRRADHPKLVPEQQPHVDRRFGAEGAPVVHHPPAQAQSLQAAGEVLPTQAVDRQIDAMLTRPLAGLLHPVGG